jgi:hypothetical protein
MCCLDNRKPLTREDWRGIWGNLALVGFVIVAVILTLALAGPAGRWQ